MKSQWRHRNKTHSCYSELNYAKKPIFRFFIFWKLTELCRFVTYLWDDPRSLFRVWLLCIRQQQQLDWRPLLLLLLLLMMMMMMMYVCMCVCSSARTNNSPSNSPRSAVQRSVTSIKQMLLDWCRSKVKGYKVCHTALPSLSTADVMLQNLPTAC